MKSAAMLAALVIVVGVVPSLADLIPLYITGTSTATLVTEGDYAGWYLYELGIEWDLNHQGTGLSH